MSLPVRRTQAAPWLKDALWRKAQAVPSLDLLFADNKSLVDAVSGQNLVTFSRASTGTYIDSTGTLRTAVTNEPRFDHNPLTGESLGLLVEEQRTNSIRNSTMVGAVAGTPGTLPTNWATQITSAGISREVIGTGVENGINYVDIRFSGTAASGGVCGFQCEPNNSIAALNGQSWTTSVYIKLVGGSIANLVSSHIYIDEYTSALVFLTGQNTSVSYPTSKTARVSATRTNSNALTAYIGTGLRYGYNINAVIDITLRIGLPQIEQGAFATSVIPTTTAAATRSADVVEITGSNFSSWYRQDEGTVYHQGRTPASANFFSIDDGTVSNRITSYMTSNTTPYLFVATGGTAVANLTSSTITASSLFAQANAYKAAGFAISTNGGTVSASSTGAVPVVNKMVIGANVGGSALVNGTIRRLTFFPARLPNTALQRLTQ